MHVLLSAQCAALMRLHDRLPPPPALSVGPGQYSAVSVSQNSTQTMSRSPAGQSTEEAREGTWKYFPQTRQAYTFTGLSEMEQHFSKSKSRFCAR